MRWLYCSVALVTAVACKSTTETQGVRSVTITGPGGEKSITVALGGRVLLKTAAKDANGVPVTGSRFSFLSRAPQIASVDSTGQLTATGNGRTFVLVMLTDQGQSLKDSLEIVVTTPNSTLPKA